MNTSIRTSQNLYLDYADPQPDMIHIGDIAYGLANENRYCGQTMVPYSVAQHSVLVAQHLPRRFRFEGLLHDATEAYMKDIPSPLKQLLPDYRKLEKQLDEVIRFRFNLPPEESAEVKEVDTRIRMNEMRDLFGEVHDDQYANPIPGLLVRVWDYSQIVHTFMHSFKIYQHEVLHV